jgi:hypothetical protein
VDERRGEKLHPARFSERLGAWLRISDPPEDVYVPPLPKVKFALVLVGVGALVALIALSVGDAGEGRKREERALAAAQARARARVVAEQTPRTGRLTGPVPAGASVEELRARRRRLVRALEAAVTADARQRHRRGQLANRVRSTSCTPYVRPRVKRPPEPPPRAAFGKYECLAVTAGVAATSRTEAGRAGYPFWARVDLRSGRAVWCKVNPRPAEGAIGGDVFVPLKPPCDLKKDGPVPA